MNELCLVLIRDQMRVVLHERDRLSEEALTPTEEEVGGRRFRVRCHLLHKQDEVPVDLSFLVRDLLLA